MYYKRKFSNWAYKHNTVLNRGPCPNCNLSQLWKNGVTRSDIMQPRYRCRSCGHSYVASKLTPKKKTQIEELFGFEPQSKVFMTFDETLQWEAEQDAKFLEVDQFIDHRPEPLKKWMHEHGRN